MKRIPALENSVLVVAHPDDEVLWFSSLLSEIDLTIIVFQDYQTQPDLGERRTKAIAELPFEVICLEVYEAGTFGIVNWDRPEISPFGMVLNDPNPDEDARRTYEKNFHSISAQLRNYLSADMNVFTHNPWGEYGHADHVQIYRIIEDLRAELGFESYVSSYFSSRTNPLVKNYAASDKDENFTCPIDSKSSQHIADIYKRHGCWTWANDWVWNKEERFLQRPALRTSDGSKQSLIGSNLLRQIPSSPGDRIPPSPS
jgi:hypothetical protein